MASFMFCTFPISFSNFVSLSITLWLIFSYFVPLQETVAFTEKHLWKFFKTGDHIKVIAGIHKGAIGMIVKNQNNIVTWNATKEVEKLHHPAISFNDNLVAAVVKIA